MKSTPFHRQNLMTPFLFLNSSATSKGALIDRLFLAILQCALVVLFCGAWPMASWAQSAPPEPPEVSARAYLLLDVTANQILASRDLDMPVEPASLTKLMTAYLVFDALKSQKIELKQTLGVSERAWKMPGSRMFIDPKMKVPVEDLIKGMIVQSGNDATVVLAEGVAGSVERFVQLMNDQAKVLGMKNTSYKNPEGLTQAGHITTARDLATLATRLMHDFPEYVGTYAIKKYRYPGTPAANDSNRNLLLFKDPTVDGLKTGHTEAAGYCMVATAKRIAGEGFDVMPHFPARIIKDKAVLRQLITVSTRIVAQAFSQAGDVAGLDKRAKAVIPAVHRLGHGRYLARPAPAGLLQILAGFGQHLKAAAPGVLGTEGIKWNFTKFLVDKTGTVVARYAPTVTPESIDEDIARLL
jgi:hypothetical protein